MKKKFFNPARLFIMIVILMLAVTVSINSQNKRVVVRHGHGHRYNEVVVKDRHYFYRGGYFFDRRPEGYVRIAAPIGARITVLPRRCKVVYVNKVKYFRFGDIYYTFLPHERVYVVVEKPR